MECLVIIPNLMREDIKIRKLFRHVEDNTFNAKALSVEIFEMAMRLMLYDIGVLERQDIIDAAIQRLAMSSAPTPGINLSQEEVDGIIDDQYEHIQYASDELSIQLSRRIQPIVERTIKRRDVTYRKVKFFYDIPSRGSITMQLTCEEFFDERPSYHTRWQG